MGLIDVIEPRDIEAIQRALRQEVDDLFASYDLVVEVIPEQGKIRIRFDVQPRTREERLKMKDKIALARGGQQ